MKLKLKIKQSMQKQIAILLSEPKREYNLTNIAYTLLTLHDIK